MKYRDIIGVNENFQYSVNLQFDINNIEKIKEYIPTKDGCELLKSYLNSIMYGKNINKLNNNNIDYTNDKDALKKFENLIKKEKK